MGMFDLLLGRKPASAGKSRNSRGAGANSTQYGASQMTQGSTSTSQSAMRKDLLRVFLARHFQNKLVLIDIAKRLHARQQQRPAFAKP